MEPSHFLGRIKGLFPIAALALVALVAVTTAMTILGNTQAGATFEPPSLPVVKPTASTTAPSGPALATETDTPVPTVPLPSTPPVVLTIYKGDRDPHRIWFVVWRYPQLRTGSTPLAGVVNQDIVDEVTTRIATFEEGPAVQQQLPGKTNNLTGTFTVDMVSWDLVSFTLKWVDDTAPGHPSISIETVNYALDSGQRLDFGQIFLDTQAAVAIISQQSQEQLRKSLGKRYDATLVAAGAGAVADNFDDWALTPAGLKVVFAEFQVGTAAVGMPSVSIPWASLKGVMQPNGPAARLAGLPTPG
jgi:hypothetical protein